MLLRKDRGAKRKSSRASSRIETVKGLFAEAIKMDGIFICWFAGEYFADCRSCGALSVFIRVRYETAASAVSFCFKT